MKITSEILKKMSFKVVTDDQYIEIYQSDLGLISLTRLKKNRTGSWDLRIHQGEQHTVTDVEEIAFFAHRDGFDSGKLAMQQKIRETLGIKEYESHFCACCTPIG